MVGTDGFRLSYCEVRIPVPDQFLKNGICLSKRALTELLRMSNEGFENINVAVSSDETTLNVSVPGYQIFVRLSAVKYPNYSGVLPKSSPAGVQVSRPQLQQVAKRVLLASDKNRALQLSFSDSSLTLTSKTVGSSEGKETIKLDDYHGPKCQLAVNGKFLSDVFATTQSDRLVLQFSSEDSPVVILPRTEPTACKSKHVLVPIKEAQ
jgi:DNA polymerase III sliding clamp (beta) subunit (PCNA family)